IPGRAALHARTRLATPPHSSRAERWPSGRWHRLAKAAYGLLPYRGFESPPLRQLPFDVARTRNRSAWWCVAALAASACTAPALRVETEEHDAALYLDGRFA